MKEFVLHRLTSIVLIPACLLYPFYSNPYILVFIYFVLCYHVLHGLISIYEDYIQNVFYRNTAIFVTYFSFVYILKVALEMLF